MTSSNVLYSKEGFIFTKNDKNDYTLSFSMQNNSIVLSKIIDFNLIKLIYDLNGDIYEKININIINENEAIANLLINYDLPWSAGLAVQRNGRIKRASSRWPSIIIQDIIVKDSIEERQHEMLQQKNAVADAVMDGEGINSRGGIDLTVGSLIGFLQKQRP